MKALTLTQPWATLVAISAKKIETRSWCTHYRGPLAIHAAKGFPKHVKDAVRYDMRFFAELNPAYAAHMARSGMKLPPTSLAFETLARLPVGAIVATCRLVNCRKAPRRALGGPTRSWRYRQWIRSLPCAACGLEPAGEAAHTGSDGGLRQKSSDFSAIPLCPDCHRFGPGAYHAIGRRQFERRRSIDIDALVRRLNDLWRQGRKAA